MSKNASHEAVSASPTDVTCPDDASATIHVLGGPPQYTRKSPAAPAGTDT